MGKNKELAKPGKKADISRIPPPIPRELSKKFLEKSKYYKDKGKSTDIQATLKKVICMLKYL